MAAPFPTSGQVDNVCTKSVRPDDITNDRNGSNPAVHGAGTRRVILSTSSAPARCPAARNKMFAHLHARHPFSSVQRMLAVLEDEVPVRRAKGLGRQTKIPPRGTPDLAESPRSISWSNPE